MLILAGRNSSRWTVVSLVEIMRKAAGILVSAILQKRFLSILLIKLRNIEVRHTFSIISLILVYFRKLLRRIVTHWQKLRRILKLPIVDGAMGFRSCTQMR